MIKKQSLPSETEFFVNKEGDINPPPPQGQRDKETVPSVRTKGASEQKCPNKRCPNKRSRTKGALHQQLRQSASRESREDNQHQENPKTIFWSQTSPKTRRFFFQGFQTSPDQEGLTFFVADFTKR